MEWLSVRTRQEKTLLLRLCVALFGITDLPIIGLENETRVSQAKAGVEAIVGCDTLGNVASEPCELSRLDVPLIDVRRPNPAGHRRRSTDRVLPGVALRISATNSSNISPQPTNLRGADMATRPHKPRKVFCAVARLLPRHNRGTGRHRWPRRDEQNAL